MKDRYHNWLFWICGNSAVVGEWTLNIPWKDLYPLTLHEQYDIVDILFNGNWTGTKDA